MQKSELQNLEQWFLASQRRLPWRKNPSPYRVLVSEIMLQQTRASAVIPYFENWMQRFPTISDLALAKEEEVIKLWEGLGYYSRARNLHFAAKLILDKFEGEIPSTLSELLSIKGIGEYTAGAILNFAFRQSAPAIDGNVLRVLSRYYGIEEEISTSIAKKKIKERIHEIHSATQSPWIASEALIELGAVVCVRSPTCESCPLRRDCFAYNHLKIETLPYKKARSAIQKIERITAILVSEDRKILIRKIPPGEIMQDLYEFPYFAFSQEKQEEYLSAYLKTLSSSLQVVEIKKWDKIYSHSFTKYKAFLHPYSVFCTKACPIVGHEWHHIENLCSLPFSSGHRKILSDMFTEEENSFL